PFFYEHLSSPIEFFENKISLYFLDPLEITRQYDKFISDLKSERNDLQQPYLTPPPDDLFADAESLALEPGSKRFRFLAIEMLDADEEKASESHKVFFKANSIQSNASST